jgi:choice-of-anchor B domain-containing protein
MRAMRRVVGITLVTAGLVLSSLGVATAHDPTHDETGPKAANYDGHVSDPSPGGVPMAPLTGVRCEDGMADIFPCHKVDLDSFLPLTDLGVTFINDIWGWVDPVTGMQLAIVGVFEGTLFVDVTDGEHPVVLGTLPALVEGDFGNIWGDIRVAGETAFIVTESIEVVGASFEGGMQTVDLTQFRSGPVSEVAAGLIDDFSQAHNVAVNQAGDRLYVVGAVLGVDVCPDDLIDVGLPFTIYPGGPIVYDVSDPTAPQLLGCFADDGYTHDIQCVTYAGPDPDHQGREICIGANEDTVTIADLSGGRDTWEVLAVLDYQDAEFFPEGAPFPSYYTHQGWLSEDHTYFFLGDELDELSGLRPERTTYIWDLTDLDDAQVVGIHGDGNESIDHNIFVHEGLLYQSNYTSGLWIYDAWKADQGRLTMRGYFDVFPSDDRTDFYGSWGNYPYFGDGKVVVTSSDEGLFVLQSRARSSDRRFRSPAR